jgi:hypothetical protein
MQKGAPAEASAPLGFGYRRSVEAAFNAAPRNQRSSVGIDCLASLSSYASHQRATPVGAKGTWFTARSPSSSGRDIVDTEAKWDALLIGAVGIGAIFIVLGILLMSGVFDAVALAETLRESA